MFPHFTRDEIFTLFLGFFSSDLLVFREEGARAPFALRSFRGSLRPFFSTTHILPKSYLLFLPITSLPRPTHRFHRFIWQLIPSVLNYLLCPCLPVSFSSFGVISSFSPKLYFVPKPNYKHTVIRAYFIHCLLGWFSFSLFHSNLRTL